MPTEGQPSNLPRLLGGTLNSDPEDSPPKSAATTTKYWDEGWYLWTGQSRWAAHQKTGMMMLDLQMQREAELRLKHRKEVWDDYQEHLKHGVSKVVDQQTQSQWWGAIVPPKPLPNTRYVPDLLRIGLHSDGFQFFSSVSLLVPLPPDFPSIFEKIYKFLKPTYRVLNIMHESIVSGEQKQFALRVWEKANSDEPFILAQWTIGYVYEQWKKWDASDDGKTDAT